VPEPAREDPVPIFDLESTYLGLDGQGRVTPMKGGPEFWANVASYPAAAGGTLVTVGTAEGDWNHWEMHPNGDEVLVLLEGTLQMVFERPGGDEVHDMRPGATLVVPAGIWHRGRAQKNVRMLFMTFGKGTQHKPVA
jgi:mannose-6-phosphate isomerase-like protein (cupin superfamily)